MQPQFDANETVWITLLTASGTGTRSTAQIVSCAGRRLSLSSRIPAQRDTAFRLESSKYIVMGEVAEVRPTDGICVLQIRHILRKDVVQQIAEEWT